MREKETQIERIARYEALFDRLREMTGEILRSAEEIRRALPSCELCRLRGLRHGEFSMSRADLYADEVRRILHGR